MPRDPGGCPRGRGTPWAIIGDALSIALLKMEQIPRFGRQIGHPRYMPCNTVTTVGHCSDSAERNAVSRARSLPRHLYGSLHGVHYHGEPFLTHFPSHPWHLFRFSIYLNTSPHPERRSAATLSTRFSGCPLTPHGVAGAYRHRNYSRSPPHAPVSPVPPHSSRTRPFERCPVHASHMHESKRAR